MIQLEKKLLIASPTIDEDTIFHRSLIYIEQHNDERSVGFIVNKPSDVKLQELAHSTGMEQEDIHKDAGNQAVYIGGPVNTSRLYILHQEESQSTIESDLLGTMPNLNVSSSEKLLRAIATGEGPTKYLTMLGCASWEQGQLEREFIDHSWIPVACVPDIVFDANVEERAFLAARHLGFNLNMMVAAVRN